MKIKTITCHDVYNYGASLQAYALMHYLEPLGHEVEIIDYKPEYLSQHYKLCVSNPRFDKPVLKQLYLFIKMLPYLYSLKKKKKFDAFKNSFLKLTSDRYHSNEDLKNNLPDADIYIAGSDQIWNTLFNNGKDPAFYLDFVPASKIKASYAASMATDKLSKDIQPFVKSMVEKLDFVGVRESSAAQILSDLGIDNIHVVCDPVFLLSKEQWMSLIDIHRPLHKKPYVFVYDFERSSLVRKVVDNLKKTNNLDVVSIGWNKLHGQLDDSVNFGPLEFLNLVYHAEYVVSNSFHATAFSIIFQKEFYVIRRSEHINTRMEDLLGMFHLKGQLVSDVDSLNFESINYKEVDIMLDSFVNQSKNYIEAIVK